MFTRSVLALLAAAAVLADDASLGGHVRHNQADAPVDEEIEMQNGVGVLNAGNIDNALQKYPASLVMFYAHNCNYSKELTPVYESAAHKLSSPDILLAKVDAIEEEELALRYNLSGTPTLILHASGQPGMEIQYYGQNDEEEIIRYVQGVLDGHMFHLFYLKGYFMYKRRVQKIPIGEWQKEYLLNAFPWVLIPFVLLPYLFIWSISGETKTATTVEDVPPSKKSQGKKRQ